MASFVINSLVSTQQTLTGSETGLITRNGTLSVQGDTAVRAQGSESVTVLGALVQDGGGPGSGIHATGTSLDVYVGDGAAIIAGSYAVRGDISSSFSLTNDGSIRSTVYSALSVAENDGTLPIRIINNGHISGGYSAANLDAGFSAIDILNNGYMSGAIGVNVFDSGQVRLTNTGTISGTSTALLFADGPDIVKNAGTIIGAVGLEDGGDRYEGDGDLYGDFFGGSGDDTIEQGGTMYDALSLGIGNDLVINRGHIGGEIYLEGGNDRYRGAQGTQSENIFGGDGADTIEGSQYADAMYGGGEADRMSGLDGDDVIYSGLGDDVMRGGRGQDYIAGNAGADLAYGGSGDDTIIGEDDADQLRGNAGDDLLDGGNGIDTLFGASGQDALYGGRDRDSLYGGSGDDLLDGGNHSDLLDGGHGDDTLTGGARADVFVLRRVGNGDDVITDFENGFDQIDLSQLGILNFNRLNNTFNAISADDDGVIIDLAAAGGSGSVRLLGIATTDLDASDFIF